ncbi:MAG: hypothetical protein EAZ81_13045 [Verrucomicrobia bacterium]|nr:MAG: hypothetical protein EAZ81_13045 [Verrucomicrobiota bacterium]
MAYRTHDHFALTLASGAQLRYHDPRRFGIVTHVVTDAPFDHPLFQSLGPEPFDEAFSATSLKQRFSSLARPIKLAIMDNATVVGVGNIYASESLFHAGIHPATPAGKISRPRLDRLVTTIREVLQRSIEQGGTTLRDFLRENGEPGYFRQQLSVYERADQPCNPVTPAEISFARSSKANAAPTFAPLAKKNEPSVAEASRLLAQFSFVRSHRQMLLAGRRDASATMNFPRSFPPS